VPSNASVPSDPSDLPHQMHLSSSTFHQPCTFLVQSSSPPRTSVQPQHKAVLLTQDPAYPVHVVLHACCCCSWNRLLVGCWWLGHWYVGYPSANVPLYKLAAAAGSLAVGCADSPWMLDNHIAVHAEAPCRPALEQGSAALMVPMPTLVVPCQRRWLQYYC